MVLLFRWRWKWQVCKIIGDRQMLKVGVGNEHQVVRLLPLQIELNDSEKVRIEETQGRRYRMSRRNLLRICSRSNRV